MLFLLLPLLMPAACSLDDRPQGPPHIPSGAVLFWTQQWGVYRCDLEGKSIRTIYHDPVNCSHAIAVDGWGGKIYWGEQNSARPNLRRADLDGSHIEDLISGSVRPEGIVLDLEAGKIYWADSKALAIRRANLSGSDIEDIHSCEPGNPRGIGLDPTTGQLYWTDILLGVICRSDKNGGPVDTVLSGLHVPDEFALDPLHGKMYWIQKEGIRESYDLLIRANLDGTSPDTLVSGEWWLGGVAVDPERGKLYWSTPSKGFLSRANLDGSDAEVMVYSAGMNTIVGLCVDAATGILYWTYDWWPGIGRTDPDRNDITLLISQTQRPEGIALDAADNRVYWVDYSTDVIHRSDMGGESVEVLLTDPGGPHDIALDLRHNKMYWTNEAGRIQRANLDGSIIETVIDGSTLGAKPISLALDVMGKRMYWIDEYGPAICVSDMDGTGSEWICSISYSPGGIALDLLNHRMYWSADRDICRANLDGSSLEVILTGTRPAGMALDIANGHIYWVDNEADKLQRADLNGSNVTDILEVVYRPNAVAIEFK